MVEVVGGILMALDPLNGDCCWKLAYGIDDLINNILFREQSLIGKSDSVTEGLLYSSYDALIVEIVVNRMGAREMECIKGAGIPTHGC